MGKISTKILGNFNVRSGKLIVLDPCNNLHTWCAGELQEVYCGEWTAIAHYYLISNSDRRISQLTIKSNSCPDSSQLKKEISSFAVGVDSGCAGFFDSYYFRHNKGFSEQWYNYFVRITSTVNYAGTIRHGVIALAGNGDGEYNCIDYRDNDGKIHMADLIFL